MNRPEEKIALVAKLDLQPEDDYLKIGFGSGSFMKSHVSPVHGGICYKIMINKY